MLALNPFKVLDIYSDEYVKKYYYEKELPPHVFSIAKEAYQNVLRRPQSIIIKGETGAGKTVAANHVIKFLCQSANEEIMNVLNNAAPILNSLGNATTEKNADSSRYSKFVEVMSLIKSYINNKILNSIIFN